MTIQQPPGSSAATVFPSFRAENVHFKFGAQQVDRCIFWFKNPPLISIVPLLLQSAMVTKLGGLSSVSAQTIVIQHPNCTYNQVASAAAQLGDLNTSSEMNMFAGIVTVSVWNQFVPSPTT